MKNKDPKRIEKREKRKAMAEFKELNDQIQKQMYADQFAQWVATNMGYEKGTYDEAGAPLTHPRIKSNITNIPYELNEFANYDMVQTLVVMSAKLFGIALNPSMDKNAKVLCSQMLDHVVFASQIVMSVREIETSMDTQKVPYLKAASMMLYVHALQYTLYMESDDGKRLYEDVMSYIGYDFSKPADDFYPGLKKEMMDYFIPTVPDDKREEYVTQIFEQVTKRLQLMYDNYNKVTSIEAQPVPVEESKEESAKEE